MVRARSPDTLFTSGSFLNSDDGVVDVVIYTGQRASRPGETIGHFIIEVLSDTADAVHEEVPFGSDLVRHPSVSDGVREAWSIMTDLVEIRFGQTPVDAPDVHITSLVINETVYYPAPDGFGTATL